MNKLRDNLSSLPGALSQLIGSLPTATSMLLTSRRLAIESAVRTRSPATPTDVHDSNSVMDVSASSWSGDELTERAQAIPASLITEEWQLVLEQDASISDLQKSIERCKELVIVTDECSVERKWLVRHLVELRFRLNELQDVIDDPQSDSMHTMVILGHHFVVGTATATVRSRCDHCTGIIWSVVQASYVCNGKDYSCIHLHSLQIPIPTINSADCHYRVHHKCVQSIIRICAHVTASERDEPILDIAPEVGLSRQLYKCAECETPLNLSELLHVTLSYRVRSDV